MKQINFDRLDSICAETGISKAHLCELANRGRYYIRDIKKNNQAIPDETVLIWANALHVSPEWLCGETDEKSPTTQSMSSEALDEARLKLLASVDGMTMEQVYKMIDLVESAKKLI